MDMESFAIDPKINPDKPEMLQQAGDDAPPLSKETVSTALDQVSEEIDDAFSAVLRGQPVFVPKHFSSLYPLTHHRLIDPSSE